MTYSDASAAELAVPPASSKFRSRCSAAAALALVAIGTSVAYLPAMSGQFVWNDSDYVTRPGLQSLRGLYRIWIEVGATEQYYPLLHSAFWVEHRLWGDHPLGYHIVNVLLHLVAAGLVYLVMRKLAIPGAILGAAIFALHPVMVESVAWITEQKNTLSTVLYLTGMLAYLEFDQTRRSSSYAMAIVCYVLAIWSKTVAATLPAALLVIFWWKRGNLTWQRDIKPLLPFFAVGTASGLFTAWVEVKYIGAEGQEFALTMMQRLLLAGRLPWFYLSKLIWPMNLIFFYPRWELEPSDWRQWLYPIVSIGFLVGLWSLRRRWRGPLAGWLLFIGTLFPVLGLLNVYWFLFSFAADHLQYLASLGVIVPTAAAIAISIARVPPAARWIGQGLCVALLAVLGALTWQQTEMYSDVINLYRTTIDRNPTSWMPYNNLGVQLDLAGKVEESAALYRQALQLKPDYVEAHNNLGVELAKMGHLQEALAHYQRAIQIKPDSPQAYTNMGNVLRQLGQLPSAIEQYRKSLRLRPEYTDAANFLGLALLETGRPQEAIEQFEQALRFKPDFVDVRLNLASALTDAGRSPEAIEQLRQALQIQPLNAEAHYNLGKGLEGMGATDEAIEHYREAVQQKPKFPQAYNNLGNALLSKGQEHEAIKCYRQALRLKPDFADAQYNLGVALFKSGHPDDALVQFQEAVRVKPDYAAAYFGLAGTLAYMNRADEAIANGRKGLELARAQGQTALAEKIQNWLTVYGSRQPKAQNMRPQSDVDHASP